MIVSVAPGLGAPLVAVVTVIAAASLLPPLVAVIVADPAATPVTRPLPETVATALLPIVHITV